MLWITGLTGLSEDAVEADDLNIDYPDILALYLLGTITGANKSR